MISQYDIVFEHISSTFSLVANKEALERERKGYWKRRAKCPSLIIWKLQDSASWLAQAWQKHRVRQGICSSIRADDGCRPDVGEAFQLQCSLSTKLISKTKKDLLGSMNSTKMVCRQGTLDFFWFLYLNQISNCLLRWKQQKEHTKLNIQSYPNSLKIYTRKERVHTKLQGSIFQNCIIILSAFVFLKFSTLSKDWRWSIVNSLLSVWFLGWTRCTGKQSSTTYQLILKMKNNFCGKCYLH